jgi:hypothetical protein
MNPPAPRNTHRQQHGQRLGCWWPSRSQAY